MADYMTGTLILPTFALTLDPIAAIFYHEAEFDEQDDQPNGTTMVIQHEAPYGEFPEPETALVAAGVAFDRHSDAKWDHNGEWRYFRPATSDTPGCDSIVNTLQPDERERRYRAIYFCWIIRRRRAFLGTRLMHN